jgi:hypothetical protein
MRSHERYRFVTFWADLAIAGGTVVIALGGLGAVLGLVAAWNLPELPWGLSQPSGLALAASLAVLGLLLGGPLVVAGQCLRVFLDQRALLARILRQLRRKPRGA